jgi:hypothetical protein
MFWCLKILFDIKKIKSVMWIGIRLRFIKLKYKNYWLNNNVADEYLKSGALYLVAINGVYVTVQEINKTNQDVVIILK